MDNFAQEANPKSPDCPFCSAEARARTIAEHGSVFAIGDKYPVTEGHLLLIPRRHTANWFSMTDKERRDAEALILALREKIENEDHLVLGFNIGINCGEAAGQTVMHAHIHLIPRRAGDTPDPRGGVRGVIPGRMSY